MQKEGLHIHIPAQLKKYRMSSTSTTETWYRCLNCGRLNNSELRPNPHVALNCVDCGQGEEALIKVDPVAEQIAMREAIERVTRQPTIVIP